MAWEISPTPGSAAHGKGLRVFASCRAAVVGRTRFAAKHGACALRAAAAAAPCAATRAFARARRAVAGVRGGVDALHDLMIGREPDLTVLIDMDPAQGLARALSRRGTEDGALEVDELRVRPALAGGGACSPPKRTVSDGDAPRSEGLGEAITPASVSSAREA